MPKKSRMIKKQLRVVEKRIALPYRAFLLACAGVLIGYSIVSFIASRDEQRMIPFQGYRDTKQKIIPDNPASVSAILKTPILMYHYVEYVKDKNDTIRQSLNILPPVLEKQIQTFQNDGYTFLTMDELGRLFQEKDVLPEKRIVFTFDDGYKDFYTDVFPILQKYHVKATVYVISGSLGTLNYMTEKDVKEVAASGLVEIGAHTVHHMNLKGKSRKELEKEIMGSKTALETLIGMPVVSFCYPYGAYDEEAKAVVHDSGYTSATITPVSKSRYYDEWSIDRIRPGNFFGKPLLRYIEEQVHKRST